MLSYTALQFINPIMIILTVIFVITAIVALFKNRNRLFALAIIFFGLNSVLREILLSNYISDYTVFKTLISVGLVAIGITLFFFTIKEEIKQ